MKTTSRPMRFNARSAACLLGLLIPGMLAAEQEPSLRDIMARLDQLERQNRALQGEVETLRIQVASLRPSEAEAAAAAPEAGPTLEERVAVTESRVAEQAQTKLEASQKFPIKLSGMALVNAFTNSAYSDGRNNPTVASGESGPRTAGGTIRQSVVGLNFRGPSLPWEGRVSGALMMDFYGGAGDSLNQYIRLRTGSINFDWKNTSIMAGQEKPIVSPRDPSSLAQVAVSPLTNAGNLWLWQPQVRLEQRFALGERTMLRAQAGVYQMREGAAYVSPEYEDTLEAARPAFQSRFEFDHELPGGVRLEIAPGLHAATSHVAGASVPSRMFSVDWYLKPAAKVEFTGMFFRGKNIAGMGALRQGFQITEAGGVSPVHSIGGWSQFTFLATKRITFNLFGGQQDDRDSDLSYGGFGKNQSYGGNVMIRVAPNVILSFENQRILTTYVGQGTRRSNHYDMAVAYQF